MIRKHVLAAALGVLAFGAIAFGVPRDGVLVDKDGRIYEGMIDENDTMYLVNQRGIESRIPKENMKTLTWGTFDELFTKSVAALKKDDVAGRIALGRKAFDAKRYELAQTVLEEAVAIDPNSAEATDLLKLTQSHRRLEHNSNADHVDHAPTTPNGTTPTSHGVWTTLSADQVNRIKQLELDRGTDQKISVAFDKSAKSKYFENNPGLTVDNQPMDRVSWNKLPPATVAFEIIKNGGELAKDVRITSDPSTVAAFRKTIQPIILQGCATANCHGGNNESARKFPLINPAVDTASAYSNFLTLTTYKSKASKEISAENVFSPTMNRMIDRSAPEKSMVLAYGLPQQMTDLKHPPVKNLTSIFNKGGKTDDRYTKVLDWVKSLDDIEKDNDYGFTFVPERTDPMPVPADAAPTTAPAPTTPAPVTPAPTPVAPTAPKPPTAPAVVPGH